MHVRTDLSTEWCRWWRNILTVVRRRDSRFYLQSHNIIYTTHYKFRYEWCVCVNALFVVLPLTTHSLDGVCFYFVRVWMMTVCLHLSFTNGLEKHSTKKWKETNKTVSASHRHDIYIKCIYAAGCGNSRSSACQSRYAKIHIRFCLQMK